MRVVARQLAKRRWAQTAAGVTCLVGAETPETPRIVVLKIPEKKPKTVARRQGSLRMIDVRSGSLGHTLPALQPPSPATILGNWPVTSRAG